MIAYVDSSVLLRVILRQPRPLKEWKRITRGIASALVEVECLRTLDRIRFMEGVTDEQIAPRREAVYRLMESMEVVEPSGPILARASQPMPMPLRALDAIHLATVLVWRESTGMNLVLATHDAALGLGARASGVKVVGV